MPQPAIHHRYRVYCTAPDDAAVVAVLPLTTGSYEYRVSEPGRFFGVLDTGLPLFADQLNAGNPVQLNAALRVDRAVLTSSGCDWSTATTVWRGFITDTDDAAKQGYVGLSIAGLSKLAKLQKTIASINGQRTGSINTPTLDLDEVPLVRVVSPALADFSYFPAFSVTAAFVPTSFDGIETEIGAGGITDMDTTILATATHGGFKRTGFLLIDEGGTEEVVFYDGYQNDGADGPFQFLNVVREVLGTTAAAHSAGDTLRQLELQVIAAERECFLEKEGAATSPEEDDWRPFTEFVPIARDGYFAFNADILSFAGSRGPWEAIPRATYAVYDKTSASAVTGTMVLTALLEAAGWVDTVDFTIDAAFDNLVVARYAVDTPTNTWPAIEDFLGQLGLQLGDTDQALVVSEDPATGIAAFKIVTQKADDVAADVSMWATVDQQQRRSLEGLYSGVCVIYEEAQRRNLLAPTRAWHPDTGDTIGSEGVAPTHIAFQVADLQEEKAVDGFGWQQENITSNAQRLELAYDDNRATAWALQSDDTRPWGEAIIPLVSWFPDEDADGDPTPQSLGRVEAVLDFGWTLEPDAGDRRMAFEIVGLAGTGMDFTTDPPTYDPADYPTGNVVRLSAELSARFFEDPLWGDDYSNMRPFTSYLVQAEDLGVFCKALILRYKNPPHRKLDPDSSAYATYGVRYLRAEGPKQQNVLIQITDSTADTVTGDFLRVGSGTYDKLIDATYGNPRILIVDMGPGSANAARAIGQAILFASLLLVATHNYRVLGWYSQPRVGIDTVAVLDAGHYDDQEWVYTGARGLVQHLNVTFDGNGAVSMTTTLKDYRRGLIGAPL